MERTFGGQPPRLGAVARTARHRPRSRGALPRPGPRAAAVARQPDTHRVDQRVQRDRGRHRPPFTCGKAHRRQSADSLPWPQRAGVRRVSRRGRIDRARRAARADERPADPGRSPRPLPPHRSARRLPKQDDNKIVSRDERGIATVLFEPPPWQKTEFLLSELVARYNDALDQELAHPVVLIGAFILDFSPSIRSLMATDALPASSRHRRSWSAATASPATSASSGTFSRQRTPTTTSSTSRSANGTRATIPSGPG